MIDEEAGSSPADQRRARPTAAGCCTVVCPQCQSSSPAPRRAGKAPSPQLCCNFLPPCESESVLLLQSRRHVVASQLKSKLGHGRDTWPVSAGSATVVPPAATALPGWGRGLKSGFLILLGEQWLHLGGVLHHAGGGKRGALWKGTVRIGRQWGGVKKYSEWEQGLLSKINGERMTRCLWKIPVCGKSFCQREARA